MAERYVLTDESLMPFGKFKGKQLANVPAEYLLWLYDNGVKDPLKEYIKENMEALKIEVKRKKQ